MRDFSLERLRALLSSGPDVFFLHDVDADLGAAMAMAHLEQQLGVCSTYYLMPCSQYYNLFGPEGAEAVRLLKEAGHALALHCDLRAPRDAHLTDEEILKVVKRDFALLDAFYPGVFGRDLSFHTPPHSVVWREIPGYRSSFAPRWRGHYFADSRGVFAYGDPEDHLDERPLQVNLHPEHWMRENGDFLTPREENDLAWFEPFFGEPSWFQKLGEPD